MAECWLSVPGYEGWYDVSDQGRIARVRGGRGTRPGVLAGTIDNLGYRSVSLWRGNKGRTCRVHRLVMLAFVGPPPAGHQVNHKDGDKSNAKCENLEYVTTSQNHRHAYASGLHRIGSNKKLPAALVQSIARSNGSLVAVARAFNVSTGSVCLIRQGKRRGDVTGIVG